MSDSSQTVAIGGADIGQVAEGGSSSELIGIGVAALVLLVTFGGALAAGLPLLRLCSASAPASCSVVSWPRFSTLPTGRRKSLS
ncbi:MAG: hypothetical protein M3406_02970 [Chloroflexota bacterium]|nr:hypothetical protein [Chloroflexota bacterium]